MLWNDQVEKAKKRREQIHLSPFPSGKMGIQAAGARSNPHFPFCLALPSMVFGLGLLASMIGSDPELPVLAFLLPLLNGLPNQAYLRIGLLDGGIHCGTSPKFVSHVIRVLKIHPGKVRALGSEIGCGLFSHLLVNLMNVVRLGIVGVAQRIQFQAIQRLVQSEEVGLREIFSQELGAVVLPSGENSQLRIWASLAQVAENRPVLVIGGFDSIAPNLVLVCPGTCQNRIVADGRNGRRFGISSFLAPGGCTRIAPFLDHLIQIGSGYTLQILSRNPI